MMKQEIRKVVKELLDNDYLIVQYEEQADESLNLKVRINQQRVKDLGNKEDFIRVGKTFFYKKSTVEKYLKALEILKKHMWFTFGNGFQVYCSDTIDLANEEEYELLKEVLQDDK